MRLITMEFANWSSVQFSSYAVNKPPGIGFGVNNNNNNNKIIIIIDTTMFMVLSSSPKSLREFTQFI